MANRTPLQAYAALWALLVAVALVAVRLAGWSIPTPLLLLFSGVWLFGAAMLWWFPVFGAIGTAAYGILLSVALLRMHGGFALNMALAGGFLVGTLLALGALWQVRQARRPAA